MTDRLQKMLRKAAKTNRERDEIDHKAGFASPTSGGNPGLIDCAIEAIAVGIQTQSWDCIAEGLDMLLATTYGQKHSQRLRAAH